MNKIFFPIILSVTLILSGCTTVKGIFGKNSTSEQKQAVKIEQIDSKISQINSKRLDNIGGWSYAISYALDRSTNVYDPFNSIVRDFNERVVSVANKPSFEVMRDMRILVDELLTNNAVGKVLLENKDREIVDLQDSIEILKMDKDRAVTKYMNMAQATALKADTVKAELDKMDSWFGLGAIWYGIKKLVISSMWILGIGGLLFLVLRIASTSNPVCSAIFGIFEQMVAWFINAVKFIFPQALRFAGQVSKEAYAATQSLLTKIIDNVQNLKQIQEKGGHDITLRELFIELDKSLDTKEKEIISTIKKQLGY